MIEQDCMSNKTAEASAAAIPKIIIIIQPGTVGRPTVRVDPPVHSFNRDCKSRTQAAGPCRRAENGRREKCANLFVFGRRRRARYNKGADTNERRQLINYTLLVIVAGWRQRPNPRPHCDNAIRCLRHTREGRSGGGCMLGR